MSKAASRLFISHQALSKYLKVLDLLRHFDKEHKFIAAICAAPMVLHTAGIDKGRRLTSYPSDKYRDLFKESDYVEDEIVIVDDNLITSRGPATTLPFAYKLVDILGGDGDA